MEGDVVIGYALAAKWEEMVGGWRGDVVCVANSW